VPLGTVQPQSGDSPATCYVSPIKGYFVIKDETGQRYCPHCSKPLPCGCHFGLSSDELMDRLSTRLGIASGMESAEERWQCETFKRRVLRAAIRLAESQ